jgi:hypothetical protein
VIITVKFNLQDQVLILLERPSSLSPTISHIHIINIVTANQ